MDLNPELRDELAKSIDANDRNEVFQEFVNCQGDVPVVFMRQEKGRSSAAEFRGVIRVYDSPFWKGESESDLVPGEATAGGMGGYPAVLRHEYGHYLFGQLTIDQERDCASLIPPSDQVKRDLTSYGAKNKEEAFCEVFAIATDPRFDRHKFAPWVSDLYDKMREYLL